MLKQLRNVLSPAQSVQGRFSLALTLSGLAFGLIMAALMEIRLESQTLKAERNTLDLTAHRIAARLENDLENRTLEVQLISKFLESNPTLSAAAIYRQLERLQDLNSGYAWIGLTDPKGRVIAATDNLLVGMDVSERAWFQNGQDAIFVGNPRNALALAKVLPQTKRGDPLRFVDIALPIRRENGELIGVIGAHLLWEWADTVTQDALNDVDIAVTAEVFIADAQGTWLLKPSAEVSANRDEMQRNANNNDYVYAQATVQSKYAPRGLDWQVLVRERTEIAFAPIQESRFFLGWFLSLSTLVFAVVGWYFAGWAARPIVALKQAAAGRQSGLFKSYQSTPSSSADETGVLDRIIHDMAFRDPLTGLANRRQFQEVLEVQLSERQGRANIQALLLIDLDHFRYLNDSRGHESGDEVLIMLASRLKQLVQPPNTLARLSGDEFAVIFQTYSDSQQESENQAKVFGYELLAAVGQPFLLKTGAYHAKASVGICLLTKSKLTSNEAFQKAELAMFEAKQAGHNQVAVFTDTLQSQLDARIRLEEDLRIGIPKELVLMFQPQVNPVGETVGFEALVRWKHPTLGFVPPSQFIPIAEKSGLIMTIGQWVLRQACLQIKAWSSDPIRSRWVIGVNVSAQEFTRPDYPDQVLAILKTTGAHPKNLKLELTESIFADDVDLLVEKMQQLKAAGLGFSLDDFGTGFSSLAYLKRMPLDQLKIDQSFVADLETNPNDAAIVQTVLALGDSLGLKVVAEGVETAGQVDFLTRHGCHYFQGYLFGKPVTVDQLA